jgi:hypothetical protein
MLVSLIVAAGLGVFTVLARALGLQISYTVLGVVVMAALLTLLALHSHWQLGSWRAIFFVSLAAAAGLALKYGG